MSTTGSHQATSPPATQRTSPLMHRWLDPATSLAEVLFGLIMTLTFTLGAGLLVEDEGREGARQLLIAVIGCNVAWGIIDGALYVVNELFGRGRVRRLTQALKNARDDRATVQLVGGELDEWLDDVTVPADRDALYLRIAEKLRSRPVVPPKIRKADVLGAITSFWLVVLTSAPAALPFVFIEDARLALRVSNGILLALLFVTGAWWARYTLARPWIVGLGFLVGGGVLVAVAIALGG
jgi:hypothetical protein